MVYEGNFSQDKYQGQGKLKFPNGAEYEGQFNQNNPHGQGKLMTKNGEVLDGRFRFLTHGDLGNVPVGKYKFSGKLIDLKTSISHALDTPLSIFLHSGLVCLPNMEDPKEAMFPYAAGAPGGGVSAATAEVTMPVHAGAAADQGKAHVGDKQMFADDDDEEDLGAPKPR